MIKITEFAFTAYPVTDLARARRFYEGLFRLQPSLVYEQDGQGWIEYEMGGATFALANISPEWKPSEHGPCIAFEVEDFEGSVEDVRAAGYFFKREPMESAGCQLAVLLDPEGNAVTLHKRKKN